MAKKDEEMEVMDDADAGGSRVYELGFHLDPELPTEEVKKAYAALRGVVEKAGSIVAEGEPEKIQLAYVISRQETAGRRDFGSSFFSWIAYETSAPNHEEVLTAARADTRIVRFIDLVTDKEAARHASEMREMRMKAPEPSPSDLPVSDTELDAALESATL